MGGAQSIESTKRDKSKKNTTARFVDFAKFKTLGEIPRYPQNTDVCVNLDDYSNIQLTTYAGSSGTVSRSGSSIEEDRTGASATTAAATAAKIDLSRSLVIFISHRWLRADPEAPDYNIRPHPDNKKGEKFHLIVQGVEAIKSAMMPTAANCFLWIDYSCVDQDSTAAATSDCYQLLQSALELCDCIFTPLVDPQQWSFDCDSNRPACYSSITSSRWKGSDSAYLSRSWCRAELFANMTVPSKPRSEEFTTAHLEQLRGDLRESLQRGRRPHFLFSSSCSAQGRAVTTLPALQPSFFAENPPTAGCVTIAADAARIALLMQQLQPRLSQLREERYEGAYNSAGLKHGSGCYFYSNGDQYEGQWAHGKRCGLGKYTDSKGNVYQGSWDNDQVHGRGKWTYSNGNIYEGEFAESLPHGKGKYIYFTGAIYEGEHLRGKKHGFGKFSYSTGDVYEGKWQDSVPHGSGKYMYTDGTVYVGEYKKGQMHGHGKMIKVTETTDAAAFAAATGDNSKSDATELKKGEHRSVSDICEVEEDLGLE